MSLRVVPAYSSDKASDSFGSGFEDLGNDFFDQFLTFSPTDNEGPDFHELRDSTVQERSTYDSESADTSSASQEDIPGHCTAENRTLSLFQNTAPTLPARPLRNHQFYQESSGRAAISDSQLLSLEGITLQSPQIPDSFNDRLPASPTPVRRRHRLVENISKSLRKVTEKPTRSPIRKQTASPTMMCSSRYSQNDFDVWGQKLTLDPSKFNFDFNQQSGGPLSPPPSTRVSSASDKMMMPGSGDPHSDAFSYNQSFPPQYPTTRPADYHTPLATPTLEAHQSRRPSFQLTSPDTMHYPQTPQFASSTNWTQEPSVAEYNPYGNPNSFSSDADAPPVWWSHASTVPMAQPSPTTFHNNPQRATKSLAVQLQNELAYNANELAMSHSGLATGLMIQMPEPDHSQQSFVVSSPSLPQPPNYFGTAPPQSQHQPFHTPTHARHSSYGAHTPRQQQQQGGQYFTSPTAGHSRIRGRSASSSDSPSPKSSASPSFHVRKRRTPSRKHEPRTPSLGGGTVDFVNFTPHDSKKILTGVAPSGSSKTKARREKEALEKRRRLSQAAVRAVRAAGGSVESLVEEGLFV